MINVRNSKQYCCEDLSLIENYDLAVADTTQTWECHHRKEIDEHTTATELLAENMYFKRPAAELIFLTQAEHLKLHNSNLSEETINKRRQKMLGKPSGMKGKHHTEETKLKLSESLRGKFKGRKLSDEHKQHISDATKRAMNRPEVKAKLIAANTGRKQSPETIEKRMNKIRGTHRSAQWKKAIENKEQILNLFNSGLCYFKIEKILGISHKIIKEIILQT